MSELKPPSDPFSPYEPAEGEAMSKRWQNHLLRRAAFGVSQPRLDKLKGKSVGETLDWLFDYDPEIDPFGQSVEQLGGLVDLNQTQEVASFWLLRMIQSQAPLQERIALFWHGRFPSSGGKVEAGRLMHEQIQLFRRKGLKNYRDILTDLGHDGAMLVYLDGRTSSKGKPNENYARELMELFTLGIGNYTEKDVKELARAFTGWRVEGESISFASKSFDDGEKEILGAKGKFNSDSVIDVILAQPAAPKFLARKMLCEFVHPAPADEHVEHYAKRLLDAKWEIKPVLREMLSSRLFFSEWAYRSKIKSPVELGIGIALAVGGTPNTNNLRQAISRLGQSLCYPPNVKGWPGEENWINSNTIMLRFNFAMTMASQRNNGDFVHRSDYGAVVQKQKLESADDVINYYAKLLLDGELSEESAKKFRDYMNRDRNDKIKPFTTRGPEAKSSGEMAMMNTMSKLNGDAADKIRGLIHLMMATPEYQLA